MALSPPVEREFLHQRTIECQGFKRKDGLWDIEGRLTDQKSYGFDNSFRTRIEAGENIHDMHIRMTVDIDFLIIEVEAWSAATPYAPCGDIVADYQQLAGLRIGAGFTRKVAERVGGNKGCTHHTELVGRMATVAIQTIGPLRRKEKAARGIVETGPPRLPAHLNQCHALKLDGPVVKDQYGLFYQAPDQTPKQVDEASSA